MTDPTPIVEEALQACREWCTASGVPDDDWKSRAGFMAGWYSGEVAAHATIDELRAALPAAKAFIDSPHVVQIRENDWGLQHPPRCRSILTACPVHEFMAACAEPPAPVGDYFIDDRARITPHDGSEDAARPFIAAVERALALLADEEAR